MRNRDDKALTNPFSKTQTPSRAGEDGLARRVVSIADFTEDDMALIAAAEVPEKYAYLDGELAEWPLDATSDDPRYRQPNENFETS